MSVSQETPWTNNPYAPKISYHLYFGEKSSFAGALVGSMLYGTPKTPPRPHVHIRLSVLS